MTDEAEHKTKLVAQCKRVGAYSRRFEDRYGVGILDVLVIFPGHPVCFIEGKIIRGRNFGPTERQWIEGNRVLAVKGGHAIPILVGWTEDSGLMYVGEWTKILPTKACIYQLKGDDYAATLWRYLREHTRTNSKTVGDAREVDNDSARRTGD